MDSRFYRPPRIKYPLYSLDYKLHLYFKFAFPFSKRVNVQRTLTRKISEIFGVNDKNIRLFDSGSSSILYLLNKLKQLYHIQDIYIPAFSCMELADAIFASECNLQVYDIDKEFMPHMNFLKDMISKEDCVLIIPSYFGSCKLGQERMELLEQMKMPIIFDDAQVFPMTPLISGIYKKPWFSVISFGKGKPISGLGGGALISNAIDRKLNSKIFTDKKLRDDSSCVKELFPYVNRTVKNFIQNSFRMSNTKHCINKKHKMFDSLESLVYAKEEHNYSPKGIHKLQMIFAIRRIYYFEKTVKSRYEINEYFAKLAGTRKEFQYAKEHLSDMNFMPLCIENKDRYKLLKILGKHGIQGTIYYYPLHLIPFYAKKYDLHKCLGSEGLFGSILIIPYNLDYSNQKVIKMLELVDQSINELKNSD